MTMNTVPLVFALVLAMVFVAGVLVVGTLSRKRHSRKTARKSTGRTRKQKTTKQRKPRFNISDDEDLVEMLFENIIGERNKRK